MTIQQMQKEIRRNASRTTTRAQARRNVFAETRKQIAAAKRNHQYLAVLKVSATRVESR